MLSNKFVCLPSEWSGVPMPGVTERIRAVAGQGHSGRGVGSRAGIGRGVGGHQTQQAAARGGHRRGG